MLVAVEVVTGDTVNVIAFEVPPVAPGFVTVIAVLPDASTFVAGTIAVNCVDDTKVVASADADQ